MSKLFKLNFSILLFFTALTGALFLTAGESRAQGPCLVQVTKVAEGGEGILFDFQVEINGQTGLAGFFGGQTVVVNVSSGEEVTLTELPNPGWVLAESSCEAVAPGIEVTGIEGGVVINCQQPIAQTVQAECTFTNVRAAANIPTLSEWGMIAAAGGLALIGVFFAVRRKRFGGI